MKTVIFMLALILTLSFYGGNAPALEIPEKYTDTIAAVDFYPTGAKFTFAVEPQGNDGDFTAIIPGSFNADTIRLANPEKVYGDIHVAVFSRTKWTPSQLEALRVQIEEQNMAVYTLTARKSALEQTLSFLKNSNPEKSKPEELLAYIKDAQTLRLDTENELATLKVKLNQEQEKLRMLTAEMQSKNPSGANNYITVTGKAGGVVYIEAFTNSATWQPRYTLNLETGSGNIEAKMYIRAAQRTGLYYTGNMTLHTKTPDEHITTPEIKPLRVGIKPKEEVIASNSMVSYSRNNRMFKSARMAMTDEDMAMPEEEDDVAGYMAVQQSAACRQDTEH